ncbi:MAG: branched-chain amino acid ABC transporter permease [Acidimicrobiia bacterium]|nr:branched-chain amino acid ABC transporter permease [Acidimicrobiia bacterium]
MELFFSQIFNGIANGVVYASIALALVLIFRSTGLLNFAQGEMALFSTFLTWKLTTFDIPVAVAILLSMAISLVAGAIIERVLIRPVEQARSPLNVVIVTLGMFLAINALAQLAFGTDPQRMPSAFPSGTVDVGVTNVGKDVIGLALVLVAECVLLYVLLQRTKLGLKLRAVASNPESSRLVGINSGSMLMLGWALSAALGAAAGSFVADQRNFVDASLMQQVLVFAFAAAALGGFDSPLGAVVAGLIVGIADALTIQYIDLLDGIEVVLPLTLILVVLLVRPTGLFGRQTVERV